MSDKSASRNFIPAAWLLVQAILPLKRWMQSSANDRLQHGAGVAGAIVKHGDGNPASDAWVRQHGAVTHAEPAHTCWAAAAAT
jgi:hypothetical protein